MRCLTICYFKKQIDTSFSCVSPVIDNKFRHNVVKVVCGSTRLSPSGFTRRYFRNVTSKFIINNRTDALKTEFNLFIRIQ